MNSDPSQTSNLPGTHIMSTHNHSRHLIGFLLLASAAFSCAAATPEVTRRPQAEVVKGKCPLGQTNVRMYYGLDPREDGIDRQRNPGTIVRCTDAQVKLQLVPGDVVYLERDATRVWVHGLVPSFAGR